MRNRQRQRGTVEMYVLIGKLAKGKGGSNVVSTTAAMLVLHPKLLRSRLILIAARCKPGLVGWGAITRVLRVRCATCGISFPFFDLGSSITIANDKLLGLG